MAKAELNTPEALRWRAATAAANAAAADSRGEGRLAAGSLEEAAALLSEAGELELSARARLAAELARAIYPAPGSLEARARGGAISSGEACELAGKIGELHRSSYRLASSYEARAIRARELEEKAARLTAAAVTLRRVADELRAESRSELAAAFCECCGGSETRSAELLRLANRVGIRSAELIGSASRLTAKAGALLEPRSS